MPNQDARNCPVMTRAEIIAAYMNDREDELLDAVVTAAALVSRADGWTDPVERGQLLDFLNRNGLLSTLTRAEILDSFEWRLRQFDERRGAEMAANTLLRLAGRSPARFVIGAGEDVAAADGHLHPGERRALRLIRRALGMPPQSAAPSLS